jgi:hypothetical protein
MSGILLVVVGGAIGVLGTVIGIAASWRSQDRQLRHDREMLDTRLQEERSARREDALRAARRERLVPVMGVLEEMERYLGGRLMHWFVDEVKAQGFPEGVVPDILQDSEMEDVWRRIREAMMRGLETPEWHTLIVRAITIADRIGDRQLWADFVTFSVSLLGTNLDTQAASRTLGELHERLEVYASTISERVAS